MDARELGVLMGVIERAYPRYYANTTENDRREAVKLWYSMLGHIDAGTATMAVKKHIAVSPFPPAISDILKTADEISNPEFLSADQAWECVSRAVKMGAGYPYSDINPKEFVPEPAYSVASRMGWYDLSMSENTGVDRGQFIRLYDREVERQIGARRLPDQLRTQIGERQHKEMSRIEENRTGKEIGGNAPLPIPGGRLGAGGNSEL